MGITIGVRFFAKFPIFNGFTILFNGKRFHGDSEMNAVEPFSFSADKLFIDRSEGCASFKYTSSYTGRQRAPAQRMELIDLQ